MEMKIDNRLLYTDIPLKMVLINTETFIIDLLVLCENARWTQSENKLNWIKFLFINILSQQVNGQ
jgi:hypothetical protein